MSDVSPNLVTIVSVPDIRYEEIGLRPGLNIEIMRSGNPCIVKLNSGILIAVRGNLVVKSADGKIIPLTSPESVL